MIAYLRGTLVQKGLLDVIVEVGGIGYQVFVSGNTLQQLPPQGSQVLLHTHLIHREDAMTLFGFAQNEEREMFHKLVGVSGIGNKTALGILSHHTPAQIVEAILANRPEGLSCPGVGKKTAARIILELREKVPDLPSLQEDSPRLEAEMALLALGYTSDEIQDVLRNAPANLEPEDLIRRALEGLGAK